MCTANETSLTFIIPHNAHWQIVSWFVSDRLLSLLTMFHLTSLCPKQYVVCCEIYFDIIVKDYYPGVNFSIPGFGIDKFLMPGAAAL